MARTSLCRRAIRWWCVIDGLGGATLLEQYADFAPTLRELTATTLRAGFPATTATSILSLTVGAACGVHGSSDTASGPTTTVGLGGVRAGY